MSINDQERQSLTVWGETFSAQIRPGGMALYMQPTAPRSTEDGQPYLMEWHDLAKLRDLLDEAATRICGAVNENLAEGNVCREPAGHDGMHAAHDSTGRPEYLWSALVRDPIEVPR